MNYIHARTEGPVIQLTGSTTSSVRAPLVLEVNGATRVSSRSQLSLKRYWKYCCVVLEQKHITLHTDATPKI